MAGFAWPHSSSAPKLRFVSCLLGGSWVVISGTAALIIVTLLITPLITTHEPPSRDGQGFRALFLAWGASFPVWGSMLWKTVPGSASSPGIRCIATSWLLNPKVWGPGSGVSESPALPACTVLWGEQKELCNYGASSSSTLPPSRPPPLCPGRNAKSNSNLYTAIPEHAQRESGDPFTPNQYTGSTPRA